MEQPEICKGCEQAHTCAKAYERLGKADGPSVTFTAVVAFLLPIVLFAGTLAAGGKFLRGVVGPRYDTPVAFAVALVVTIGLMLAVSVILKRRDRGK